MVTATFLAKWSDDRLAAPTCLTGWMLHKGQCLNGMLHAVTGVIGDHSQSCDRETKIRERQAKPCDSGRNPWYWPALDLCGNRGTRPVYQNADERISEYFEC